MKEAGKQYIKYLGEMRPLDEVISVDALSEAEILDEVSKFYFKMSKQVTKERTEIYQKSLGVAPRSIKIDNYHMNHDRSFWRKIGSIMPDYKKRMKILNGSE